MMTQLDAGRQTGYLFPFSRHMRQPQSSISLGPIVCCGKLHLLLPINELATLSANRTSLLLTAENEHIEPQATRIMSARLRTYLWTCRWTSYCVPIRTLLRVNVRLSATPPSSNAKISCNSSEYPNA